ncbi:lysophospholipid acyltransferase family protein [Saccharomonospora sp. NPDC006951]
MTNGSSARVIPLHRGKDEFRGTERADAANGAAVRDEPARDSAVVAFPRSNGTSSRQLPSDPLARIVDFLKHRVTGDYSVDEFGFDTELTDTLLLPPLRVLYEKWFRVSTHGVENLPLDGGALLVCNHSGVLPIDSVMTAVAVHDDHPHHRHLRMLGADLVFKTPLLGTLARRSGQTLACGADAERLLSAGELVGVWPEGFKGVGKPFSARYKLQRFGRGGFVSSALRAGVPLIPVSIVGAEEIYPKIADLKPLARLLGLPYFPVTPFFPLLGPLGAIPLPTKWHIEFGEPIRTDRFDHEAHEDPMLVFNLTDQVREAIQVMLYRRLSQRRSVFRG